MQPNRWERPIPGALFSYQLGPNTEKVSQTDFTQLPPPPTSIP